MVIIRVAKYVFDEFYSSIWFDLTRVSPGSGSGQDGTASNDEWLGAATGVDGTSVILVGYLSGDFAAMEVNADGATLWTYQVSQ